MLDSQGYGINCNKEMSAIFYYPIPIGNPFQLILSEVHGKRNYSNWDK